MAFNTARIVNPLLAYRAKYLESVTDILFFYNPQHPAAGATLKNLVDTLSLTPCDSNGLSCFIMIVCELFRDEDIISADEINSIFYGVAGCLVPNDAFFTEMFMTMVGRAYAYFIENIPIEAQIQFKLAQSTLSEPVIHADAVPGAGPVC